MHDFLLFFDDVTDRWPMHMELTYSKITDWTIRIWRKGTGDDGRDERISFVQNPDLEYVCAKAHVELAEWLSENMGGY